MIKNENENENEWMNDDGGGKEVDWIAVYPDENAEPDVTAIAAATYNRLFSIQQLLYRWRG